MKAYDYAVLGVGEEEIAFKPKTDRAKQKTPQTIVFEDRASALEYMKAAEAEGYRFLNARNLDVTRALVKYGYFVKGPDGQFAQAHKKQNWGLLNTDYEPGDSLGLEDGKEAIILEILTGAPAGLAGVGVMFILEERDGHSLAVAADSVRHAPATASSEVLSINVATQHSRGKLLAGIVGGLFFVSVVVLFSIEGIHQNTLATRIDGFIGPTVSGLNSRSDLPANVPVGKNALWWIGEGVEFAGGGTTRSSGTMRSTWGGSTLSLTPRFDELDSILIVKGTLGEQKQYLRVPADMKPAPEFGFNPFKSKDAPPSSFVDRYGRVHSADEFKETIRTYGLQVWILNQKSSRIVGYKEFRAPDLLDSYDQGDPPRPVPLSALVEWIESLEHLEMRPIPPSLAEHYAEVKAGMTEGQVEQLLGKADKEVGGFQHRSKFWKLTSGPAQGVFVRFEAGKAVGDTEFGQNPDNFDRVKPGMSRNEVESIVGRPDKTIDTGDTTAEYWKIPAVPGQSVVVTFANGKARTIDIDKMP